MSREGLTAAPCREEFTAKVASLERQVLTDVFESFELARIFRRRTLEQIAERAHMTPRNYRYMRRRLARVSLRQLIGLADAHGLLFSVRVRVKDKGTPEATPQKGVNGLSFILPTHTAAPTEGTPNASKDAGARTV